MAQNLFRQPRRQGELATAHLLTVAETCDLQGLNILTRQVSRGTVVLCIQKCLQFGLDAALAELPRTGPLQLPDDAIAWVLIVPARSLRN